MKLESSDATLGRAGRSAGRHSVGFRVEWERAWEVRAGPREGAQPIGASLVTSSLVTQQALPPWVTVSPSVR